MKDVENKKALTLENFGSDAKPFFLNNEQIADCLRNPILLSEYRLAKQIRNILENGK